MNLASNQRDNRLVLSFSNLARLHEEAPLYIAGGKGVFVTDDTGKDYLEAVSAFYCASLGFSDNELIDAAMRQFHTLPMYPTGVQRTVPVLEELAQALSDRAPIKDARFLFATTGTEAVDGLIKLTWYNNIARGEPGRRKVLSRDGSYHGGSIISGGLGGSAALRQAFGLETPLTPHIAQPSWPDGALPGESEDDYAARLVDQARAVIEAEGPETIAALIAEPVSVSAGMHVPPATYFSRMRAMLDGYGIRLYADEIVTGFGRTGTFWGSQSLDIDSHCFLTSKGLSSAYQPIAAVGMGPEFYEQLVETSSRHGGFAHGGTYHGHPVAAAVALETIRIYERRRILDHVQTILPAWSQTIARLGEHPLVARTRNFGLLAGIDLGLPGAPWRHEVAKSLSTGVLPSAVYAAGLAEGIIVRPLAGSIVMAPPLIITVEEIAELERRLTRALDTVLAAQGVAAG